MYARLWCKFLLPSQWSWTYRVEGKLQQMSGPVSENTTLEFLTVSILRIGNREGGWMLFQQRIFRLILMENLFGIHSTRSTCSLFLRPAASSTLFCDVIWSLKCKTLEDENIQSLCFRSFAGYSTRRSWITALG